MAKAPGGAPRMRHSPPPAKSQEAAAKVTSQDVAKAEDELRFLLGDEAIINAEINGAERAGKDYRLEPEKNTPLIEAKIRLNTHKAKVAAAEKRVEQLRAQVITEPAPVVAEIIPPEKSTRHSEGRTSGAAVAERILFLANELKTAKKKDQSAILANIEALARDNQGSIERYFNEAPQAAKMASIAERAAARFKTDKEKFQFVRGLVEWADEKKKTQRLSEEEAIRLVSDEIEKRLAIKGAGTLSAFDSQTGKNAWNEAGLIGTNLGVGAAEGLTFGAYLSLAAQAILKTTVMYNTPGGMAFNVACVLAAAATLPFSELLKSINIFEKSANKAFYETWEEEEDGSEEPKNGKRKKAKKSGKDEKKKLKFGHALFAGIAGIGAYTATEVAPKVATVAVAEGMNMLSTAAAFRQGERGSDFVKDTKEAMAQVKQQLGQVLVERVGERHDQVAPMPPLVRKHHDQFESITDQLVEDEIAGKQSVAGGGSGVPKFGPAAAKKKGLVDGYLPPGIERSASIDAGYAWALEQRKNFSYVKLDAEGKPIPLLDPEGKQVVKDGVPQFERVPIEFLTNRDGTQENVADWIERRYEIFEGKAQDILVANIAQMNFTEKQAEYLSDRLIPINIKLDLLRARIQGTDGFSKDTEKIKNLVQSIDDLFYAEYTVPCDGLTESLINSLRQISPDDAGIQIDSPELKLQLDKLENLKAPEGLTIWDLVNVGNITDLYVKDHNPLGQLLFAGIFGSIFLQGFWKNETGKRRARKHARIMKPQFKKLFGERVKEGDEYKIAAATSEGISEMLKGLFANPEVNRMKLIGKDAEWLFLDPSFVLFSMRQAGEHSGELAKADFSKPNTWSRLFAKTYLKGALEFFHGATTVSEVKVFTKMRNRYRNRETLTKEVFGEMLPGYATLVNLVDDIRMFSGEGTDPKNPLPQLVEASTAFKDTFSEMIMGHLIARTRYARTRIDYYEKAYEDLRKNGKFEDLGVGPLPNLPKLDLPFGETSAPLSDDAAANLKVVRDTGFRSMVIAQIEKDIKVERETLEQIQGVIKSFEDAQDKRTSELTTSFTDRLAELKRELVKDTTPVQASGDKLLKEMSARGGLDRIVREQLQSEIRESVREQRARKKESGPRQKEYSVESQYEALNLALQQTVHDTNFDNENSMFIDDRRLYRYICNPKMVLRNAGYKGAIAEYYALSFRVTEAQGKETVYEDELPIQTLFAKELSPNDVAGVVQRWIAEKRSEASMVAKLHSIRKEVSQKRRDVALPSSIQLRSSDAENDLDKLYDVTLPEARVQDELKVVQEATEDINDAVKQERKSKAPDYREFFDQLADQERTLARITRELENPKPAFQEDKRRVKALAEFLKTPEADTILRIAKASFEYLPDLAPRNLDLRLTDNRVSGRLFRGSVKRKSVEVNADKVFALLHDPAFRTDAERARALTQLFNNPEPAR